ncbi:hypothetical protein [Desulfolithobacter sp.]
MLPVLFVFQGTDDGKDPEGMALPRQNGSTEIGRMATEIKKEKKKGRTAESEAARPEEAGISNIPAV